MADNQQAPGTPEPRAGATKVRLREYETLFLVKADTTDEGVDRIKERLRAAVTRDGGKVLKFTHWGKKKTAFVVAKQPRAVYVHASYLGNPGIVAEVERNLAIVEDVTKYMSKHIADDIDPDTRAVEADVKLAGDEERPRPERGEPGFEGFERGERGDRGDRGERDRDREREGGEGGGGRGGGEGERPE